LSFSPHYHSSPLHLHSFPTRRSSDLRPWVRERRAARRRRGRSLHLFQGPRRFPVASHCSRVASKLRSVPLAEQRRGVPRAAHPRSEEHTSELQSPCNLVCRLLLEKKN